MPPLYDQEQPQLAPPPPRAVAPPATTVYARRRAVALGVGLALLLVLVSLVRGDSGSPFGAASVGNLTAAQAAKLPWRQRYISGSAGPLDGRGLPSPAAQREAVRRFYRLGLPVYCGGARGNYAAITFDDGPSQHSGDIMRLLRKSGAQTTYFVIGENVSEFANVPRQQLDLGTVADHTWTHPNLVSIGPAAARSELERTQQTIQQATGEQVTLMRPPYGARDATTDRVAHQLGLLPVMWDSDTQDSLGAGSETIVTNAIAGLRPGGIVLMHENHDTSLAALPRVLSAAQQKGLRLVSIPELLALDPPTESQVRAGADGCSDRQRFQSEQDSTAMRLGGSGAGQPAT